MLVPSVKDFIRVFLYILFTAVSCVANAQLNQITVIDLYGNRKVDASAIRAALPIKINDTLGDDFDRDLIMTNLLAVPGVKKAWVAPVCCDNKAGGWMLYIGIKEDTVDVFRYRPSPSGHVKLSPAVMADYTQFNELIHDAVMKGEATEDDTKGHAYLTYPPAKPIQDRFLKIAREQQTLLRQVLKYSSLPEHREAAAWILPFTSNKKSVVPDLLSAAHDENEGVRNNAVRALAVLGKYAAENPSAGIVIPGKDFIAMIHSLVWTDRNKGLAVLEALTKKRDPSLLRLLKEQSLDDLSEMALWSDEGHAFYALLLLGRMAGIPEEKIIGSQEFSYADRKTRVLNWLSKIRAEK